MALKTYIWGTGVLAQEIVLSTKVTPNFYIDNNLRVCGTLIDGVPVISTLDIEVKDARLIIASGHYYQIYIQALEIGFAEKQIGIVFECKILSPTDSKLLINKDTDHLQRDVENTII